MGKKYRKYMACILAILFLSCPASVLAEPAEEQNRERTDVDSQVLELTAPSAVLMEADTGQILLQKNEKEQRSPASITKIMTLLLIFEELEKGSIKMEDQVTTSAYAKSMGGSQVFLEEGEQQSVETMIKCIVIASGNDASVAMAEHIAGSEQEFVTRMNKKAKELGMNHTNFEDCCGLTDSKNHYSTAEDVAIMSRELIHKYPEVLDYSSIWMEDITHVTAQQGSTSFTLANTNKLIRSYEGCLGLKTGSTSTAKYCVSAVAERNDLTLLAVVMGAPEPKARFQDASRMLDYGFGICSVYSDDSPPKLENLSLRKAVKESVPLTYEGKFRYLDTEGISFDKIKKELRLPDEVEAPVKKGEQAGELLYSADGKKLGSLKILYGASVEKAGYSDYLKKIWETYLI